MYLIYPYDVSVWLRCNMECVCNSVVMFSAVCGVVLWFTLISGVVCRSGRASSAAVPCSLKPGSVCWRDSVWGEAALVSTGCGLNSMPSRVNSLWASEAAGEGPSMLWRFGGISHTEAAGPGSGRWVRTVGWDSGFSTCWAPRVTITGTFTL